jgi:hypothetical protein
VAPSGVGVFRVPQSVAWYKRRADVLLGPIPLYGVTKVDWSESESDVKFRAQASQFFGHQEGDTFAMTIHGVLTGDIMPFMVNLLRILKALCHPRPVASEKMEEKELKKLMLSDTGTLMLTADVDERGLQVQDVTNSENGYEDARFRIAVSKWQTYTRWNFPVVLPYTSFYACYIETVNFSHVPDEHGNESLIYSIFLRRFKDEPKRVHGTIEKTVLGKTFKVAVSYFKKATIPSYIKDASRLYNTISTSVFGLISVLNVATRMSMSKMMTMQSLIRSPSSGELTMDVPASSSVKKTSTEDVIEFLTPGNMTVNKVPTGTEYTIGTVSMPVPVNLSKILLTTTGFDKFAQSTYEINVSPNMAMEVLGYSPVPTSLMVAYLLHWDQFTGYTRVIWFKEVDDGREKSIEISIAEFQMRAKPK